MRSLDSNQGIQASFCLDKEARKKAANVLTQFYQGDITTDQFQIQWDKIETDDSLLKQIYWCIWGFYDDLWPYKLKGRHALDPMSKGFFERCIIFLHSDLEWPIRIESEDITEPTDLYKAKKRLSHYAWLILILMWILLIIQSIMWLIIGLFLIPICLYLMERGLYFYWKQKGVNMEFYRYRTGMEYYPFTSKEQYETCLAQYKTTTQPSA